MKKILLSVLALLAFAASGMAQTLPSYVPANGLVGWWPFNGNANDESGNNNNGTVNGATLTTDRFGNQGSAYGFDGTNYISVIDNSNLKFSSHTISAWYYRAENPLPQTGVCANPGNEFLISKGRDIDNNSFTIAQGNTIGQVYQIIPTQVATNYSLGVWDNIIGSYDSVSNTAKFYINGILASSVNNVSWNCFSNISDLTFGVHSAFLSTSCTFFYKGKLDDIAIYNRALTQQEITGLYQGANSTASCPTFPASLTQGLVGYWPFCGNALDESGNNNHGTVNGATLTTDRFGNAGSAYSFDGSGTHIQTPLIQNQISKYSISTWFKTQTGGTLITGRKKVNVPSWIMTDTIGLTMDLINEPGGNPDIGKMRFMADGQFYQCGKLTPESLNSTLRNNNWHHIVGVWDGSTSPPLITPSSFSIYVDGILISCTDISLNSANAPINGYMGILFGKHSGWGNWSNFNGSLDDIAIWNRALTPQEITQLYNQGICQTSITVTDTLLIHTGITSYNPVAYGNTLKVWPNPGNTAITLDAGNLALMQGWKIRISNSLGQEVYPATLISQQQQVLSMSTWGGNGLYLLHLINPQGHITEVKKIVLAP